jgi:vacuolar-type H+-ATPase subunit I/STV1
MKHLKSYKLFESEFFDSDYIDTLLDKISDSGIESLSDIEKNQLKLFSEDDKEVIETIEKMADITNQFRELNQKMKDIQSEGGDAKYLMEDWFRLNDELVPLEQAFRKWGIELGDPRLDRLQRRTRPDAYNRIDL